MAIKILNTSLKLLDSRKWMALSMLAYIFLPSSTAFTIVLKLSSASTISDALLVTSVPMIPILIPISAFLMLGASLTPSPVIATTSDFF